MNAITRDQIFSESERERERERDREGKIQTEEEKKRNGENVCARKRHGS